MKKLILASNNIKKIKEMKELLKDLNIEIKSLNEENINIDVEEDGSTFEENAKKKAKEIYDFLNLKILFQYLNLLIILSFLLFFLYYY